MLKVAFAFTLLSMMPPTVGAAAAEAGRAGHTIQVRQQGDFVHRVLLDGRPLYVNKGAASVTLVSLYGDEAHAFALIQENSGGNACPALFRAVDITAAPTLSKPFGTCSDIPTDIRVESGHLALSLPRMDGQGTVTYSFAAGHLTQRTRLSVYHPHGPSRTPGQDLVTLVAKHTLYDAVEMKAVAQALTAVMGEGRFTASRKRIQGGVAGSFETRGDVTFASACVPHACGDQETAWAFDHAGHAWASWTDNGRTTVFGNPPPPVRKLLDPRSR